MLTKSTVILDTNSLVEFHEGNSTQIARTINPNRSKLEFSHSP